MRQLAVLLVGCLAVTVTAQPNPPLPPTIVKLKKSDATLGELAVELSRASGVPIVVEPALLKAKCPAAFAGVPLWEALEHIATQTNSRIVLVERGHKVRMEPRGVSKTVAATSGAFRVVVDQVVGRALLGHGLTLYEVNLDIHWEPRYTVFRIDSNPKITRATDDRGTLLTSKPGAVRVQPDGAVSTSKVSLGGLTRDSKQIAVLAGEFRVTATPRMLAFKFADLTAKLPQTQTQEQVTVALKRFINDETAWVVELELTYPPGQPTFESFEAEVWLRHNRPQLVSPGGGKTFDADSYEYSITDDSAGGRKVLATYGFKGVANPLARGWSLVYETPAPLIEFAVPFELRAIPLP